MPILDTFLILFKTNAEEAVKGTEKVEKAGVKVKKGLEEQNKLTNDLISGMWELAAAGSAAIGAVFSVGAFKKGITDAYNFNFEIQKQSKLIGINANELAAWGRTVASISGGPANEFADWMQQISQQYAALGQADKVKNIPENLLKLADTFKRLKDEGRKGEELTLAQQWGIPPDVLLSLEKGRIEFEKILTAQQKMAPITDENAQATQAFHEAWSQVGSSLSGIFTKIENIYLPELTHFGQLLASLLSGDWTKAFNLESKQGEKAWKKLTGNTSASSVVAADPNSPLGIRNNNPGNLRPGGVEAAYASLAEGLAAEQHQLELYGRRGINTLRGIGSHWAPPNENNTGAYVTGLAASTGFNPDQPLDLSDPQIRAKIANAINKNENGKGYGDMIKLAKDSLANADNSPLSSAPTGAGGKASSITIGHITIQTQATDANGIALDLAHQLKNASSNFDDGFQL